METTKTHWLLHVLFWGIACAAILPLLLVLIVSFTDEQTILLHGYSFWPEKFSLEAYKYLMYDSATIFRAYGITILVTLVGTLGSLLITSTLAYPLSRADLPCRKGFAFFVFFTILFNGGLVPWYLVFTQLLDVKDTIWALIVPGLLLNGFNVLIMRTFFANSIPAAVIESAYMDGAGELRIFAGFIVPLSKPVFATIGLFSTLAYWNDWYNSMIFLSDSKYYSLQYLLNKILLNIQFLSQNTQNNNASAIIGMLPQETVRMAMAIIGVGPIVFAYPFFQKYFIKGLTIGAVKG
ncbi:carbohydrate ABC transporter permease [Paenibacillus chitinolyticus]|uniref:carbohydrate ABC transporter permease n=1 Tax=Paenibacillus chitinolyticus TaxID=79263 RepID=UPI002DB5656B|nr:carbohydrate ABC transporter permease [Paenibacillus chitinolyticus]MEC0244593.1 carbohydrate ABC transporter permease [Paenibacillus chitinolyticus]